MSPEQRKKYIDLANAEKKRREEKRKKRKSKYVIALNIFSVFNLSIKETFYAERDIKDRNHVESARLVQLLVL